MFCFVTGLNCFKKISVSVAVSVGFVATSFAACPDGYPAGIVSLTDNLALTGPAGEVGKLGYLEVASAQEGQVQEEGPSRFKGRVLVTTNEGEQGFVARNLVLVFEAGPGGGVCGTNRIRVSDVPPTNNAKDTENPLQAKAIVAVTESSQASSDEGIEGVVVRASPGFDAPGMQSITNYSVVYIYSKAVVDRETWYFVGSEGDIEFRLDDDGKLSNFAAQAMLGWVHTDDLTFWSQRQAIFPRSASSPGVVFADPDLEIPLVSFEFVDEMALDRAQAVLKFPLIDSLETYNAYEIAVPIVRSGGQSSPESMCNSTQDCSEPSQQSVAIEDDARIRLSRLADNSQSLDILVVLDNTESMEAYRAPIVESLVDINNQVARFEGLRISFAMFGDTFNSEIEVSEWFSVDPRYGVDKNWIDNMPLRNPFQFWMNPFSESGSFPTLAELSSEFGGHYDDPQVDKEEMGLYALVTAVATANWRDNSFRLVFYIGDDASRTDEELYANVSQVLLKNDVLLVPINVAGSRLDASNEEWMEQVTDIVELMNERPDLGGGMAPFAAYTEESTNDIAETREKVRQVLAGLFIIAEASERQGGLVGNTSFIRDRAREMGVPAATIMDSILSATAGKNLQEIETILERNDIILTGYYPIDESETYVTLSFIEVTAMANAIRSTCVDLGNSMQVRRSLEDMAERLAQSFLGERRETIRTNESIPEFFNRITYLPDEYFSIFGDRPFGEFVDWVRDNADAEEFLEIQREICVSARLFETIANNEKARRSSFGEPVYSERSKRFTVAPNQELQEFDWLWGFEESMAFVFVPQEFFPRKVTQ